MKKRLLKRLSYWHENNEFDKIISAILEIPKSERDYEIISHLARAYNNSDNYYEAVEQSLSIKNNGSDDPLWYHRLRYAYFYLNNPRNALEEFEIAHKLDDKDQLIKLYLDLAKVHLFMEKNFLEEIDN